MHRPLPRGRGFALIVAASALAAAASACTGSSGTTGSATDSTRSSDAAPTSPDSTHSQTSKPPPPPPPAPEPGECRALSYPDVGLYANSDEPISCSKKHTAYTFAVETLPDDVAFAGVEIKNDAVQQAASQSCENDFHRFVGGDTTTRALSRLTVTYFLPKQAGFDLGAHWVRCDVVALQSANSLAPLPAEPRGILDDEASLRDFGVCSRGEPGAAEALLLMCTQDHDYRAVAALRLGEADAAYPGEDQTLTQGKEQCRELIGEQLGATGGFTYGWTYPSASDWVAGQRFGYCWKQTSH